MKIATMISYAGAFMEAAEEIEVLEKAGLHNARVPEAYGFDDGLSRSQDEQREAATAVPASFLEETKLIGRKSFVREALTRYREAGVTSLNVGLVGNTREERIKTLDQLNELMAGG